MSLVLQMVMAIGGISCDIIQLRKGRFHDVAVALALMQG
jgi:hypothetical protein